MMYFDALSACSETHFSTSLNFFEENI